MSEELMKIDGKNIEEIDLELEAVSTLRETVSIMLATIVFTPISLILGLSTLLFVYGTAIVFGQNILGGFVCLFLLAFIGLCTYGSSMTVKELIQDAKNFRKKRKKLNGDKRLLEEKIADTAIDAEEAELLEKFANLEKNP